MRLRQDGLIPLLSGGGWHPGIPGGKDDGFNLAENTLSVLATMLRRGRHPGDVWGDGAIRIYLIPYRIDLINRESDCQR
jgi:hypothetical protein